jgi:competence protein ComEC
VSGGPHRPALAACAGLALACGYRAGPAAWALAAAAFVSAAALEPAQRPVALCVALALAGWAWGSTRLDALDRSPLAGYVDEAGRSVVVTTAPARAGRFGIKVEARLRRFRGRGLSEPVLLELPRGRAPPQGAVLDALAVVERPRGPEDGFDERTWLSRRGIHVVLHVDAWRQVGMRGGLGHVSDVLRARLGASIAPGLEGERRALVEGVVLGDDSGLSAGLRDRFRASGLYHLLAVSGQNVALVAGGTIVLAWLVGISRLAAEALALAAILGYVLAVGPQPSVVRAGVAGALGSLAWLAARPRDRWYFLALGALVLLAWNPYTVLDAGFQLSFVAVVAIFVLAPVLVSRLEGYPLPAGLREIVAISTACGAATAPVLWLQFGAVPLLSVPANAMAAPAVVPLLGLAFASAALGPVSPGAAAGVAWLNGWCAAYLATCARLVGGLPFATVHSAPAAVLLVFGTAVAAAYAWRRWQTT